MCFSCWGKRALFELFSGMFSGPCRKPMDRSRDTEDVPETRGAPVDHNRQTLGKFSQ